MKNSVSKDLGIFTDCWHMWCILFRECYTIVTPQIQLFVEHIFVPMLTEIIHRPQSLEVVLEISSQLLKESKVLATLFAACDCNSDSNNTAWQFIDAILRFAENAKQIAHLNHFAKSEVLNSIAICLDEIYQNLLQKPKPIDIEHPVMAEKLTKDKLEAGIELFNKNPQKGIDFMFTNQILENSSFKVAKFLIKEQRLNRVAIGEFLSSASELSRVI